MNPNHDLVGVMRRKQIRKFIRQGLTIGEMSQKLGYADSTIKEDLEIISKENSYQTLKDEEMIKNQIKALSNSIAQINKIDEECWSIFSGIKKITRKVKEVDSEGKEIVREVVEEIESIPDARIQLEALEKIRQNNLDRAKLFKLLGTGDLIINNNINQTQTVIKFITTKIIPLALQFIPDENKKDFYDKLKEIDFEKEIKQSGDIVRTENQVE